MPIHTKIAEAIKQYNDNYLLRKDELDTVCKLSDEKAQHECLSVENKHSDNGYMTLLSEGSVLYGDNTIRLYIMKGTLAKWYDSLSDDYQGYVTVGHVSTSSFPVRQGFFGKKDMKLVTDETGRTDVLVKPHVNTKLSAIKDLIIQDEPFGISAEFAWTPAEDVDIAEYAKLVAHNVDHGGSVDVPITDNIQELMGFSFVGNVGNAKSYGYEPSLLLRNEEEHLNKKEILEKVLEHLNDKAEAEVTTETEEVKVQEVPENVVAEVADLNAESNVVEKTTELITSLEAKIAELTAENEALKAENETLKANETAVEEQFSQLEALLTKVNPSVEKLEVKKEEDKPEVMGIRPRFGGLN